MKVLKNFANYFHMFPAQKIRHCEIHNDFSESVQVLKNRKI